MYEFVKITDVKGCDHYINLAWLISIEDKGDIYSIHVKDCLLIDIRKADYDIEKALLFHLEVPQREGAPKEEEQAHVEEPTAEEQPTEAEQPTKKERQPLPTSTDKNDAMAWIKDGKPTTYRYGWAWKGARQKPITKHDAFMRLPYYEFGEGFQMLEWDYYNDEPCLCFNELSESDME